MVQVSILQAPTDGAPEDARKTAIIKKIREITDEDTYDSDPFFVLDLADVHRKQKQWVELLPRVTPMYAVKCNNDAVVVKALTALGVGFDCASMGEIKLALACGATAENIIFAHPCKPVPHLKFARSVGVHKMTFDKEEELHKVASVYPEAELVLRILPDDSRSLCRLGNKFGCPIAFAGGLLKKAKALNLNVVGVSFHVGSGCTDASAYTDAVALAKRVFDEAEALGMPKMTLLDVGGGFPGGPARISFPMAAEALAAALDDHFPEGSGVRIIAEPGRYFVASAATLVCNVIAKSLAQQDDPGVGDVDVPPHHMIYLNDGIYGSFNCIQRDHAVVWGYPLNAVDAALPLNPIEGMDEDAGPTGSSSGSSSDETSSGPGSPTSDLVTSTVWGPTCDGIDRILEDVQLPELKVGEYMVFDNMGAYSVAAGSTFNGFVQPHGVYVYVVDSAKNPADQAARKSDFVASRLWKALNSDRVPRLTSV